MDIPTNNSELIEVTKIPQEEYTESEFTPKIRTSIVSRPTFNNNYERYEWHMKNGCINQEDRDWLVNYMNSSEFKTIYG